MKIYFVDKLKKFGSLINELESLDIAPIEIKENCKFKMTKNDYVIFDTQNDFEGIEKLKNIIFLVKDQDYKYIWKLANSYKSVDIIDTKENIEYISKRIEKRIKVKEWEK